jgi:hypothetical protein
MVAYSFQKQFIEPILAGTKCQTVRAQGKRRHARVGQTLQLYYGMRTKHCRLIANAWCIRVHPVELRLANDVVYRPGMGYAPCLETFAVADGFASWAELKAFWRKHHPGVDDFTGLLIAWHPLA